MPDRFGEHCTGCPYLQCSHLERQEREIRKTPLSMEDNGADILLIFQSPGINEWNTGKPIASTNKRSAAYRMKQAFKFAGKTRSQFNITNAVQCFPGKSKDDGFSAPRDNRLPASVVKHCVQWLRRDIEAYPYKRIVVFGDPAKRAVMKLLKYEESDRIRFLKHPTGGISICDIAKVIA